MTASWWTTPRHIAARTLPKPGLSATPASSPRTSPPFLGSGTKAASGCAMTVGRGQTATSSLLMAVCLKESPTPRPPVIRSSPTRPPRFSLFPQSSSFNASINNGSSDPDGDAITVTQTPAGLYPLGTTEVMLTVTDSHGATSSCTAIVSVVETTDPVIACANLPVQTANTNASFQAPVPNVRELVRAQSFDNCTARAALNIAQSPTPGSLGGPGSPTITVTVKDSTGNDATCAVGFAVNATPTISSQTVTLKQGSRPASFVIANVLATATPSRRTDCRRA